MNPEPPRTERGQTIPEQGETTRHEPKARQPHERDESADSQARGEASQQRIGELAHDDLREGQPDTDKGPVLRELHEKKI